jgi:SAM-dependent methyltransferase
VIEAELPSGEVEPPHRPVPDQVSAGTERIEPGVCVSLINRLSRLGKFMNFTELPVAWRLPDGVDGPLWEYAHSARLAAEEDAYFADHPLLRADLRAIDERFRVPGRLIDLGCGAGRHAIHAARKGFSVTAVDLSRPMLKEVGRKARAAGIELVRFQANLCRLGFIPDANFDYALLLFSTLGMIRTRPARRRALAEARRILRPGGRLALHVHNLWLNLGDGQGRSWLAAQAWRALCGGSELGDRAMDYRGIPGMHVHLYRWGELKSDLLTAGFRIDEVLPLEAVSAAPIAAPWLAPALRAGGWLVFAVHDERRLKDAGHLFSNNSSLADLVRRFRRGGGTFCAAKSPRRSIPPRR